MGVPTTNKAQMGALLLAHKARVHDVEAQHLSPPSSLAHFPARRDSFAALGNMALGSVIGGSEGGGCAWAVRIG